MEGGKNGVTVLPALDICTGTYIRVETREETTKTRKFLVSAGVTAK